VPAGSSSGTCRGPANASRMHLGNCCLASDMLSKHWLASLQALLAAGQGKLQLQPPCHVTPAANSMSTRTACQWRMSASSPAPA
jgi:hypothetical protein